MFSYDGGATLLLVLCWPAKMVGLAPATAAALWIESTIESSVAPVSVQVSQPVVSGNGNIYIAKYALTNVPANKLIYTFITSFISIPLPLGS
jgi:hypothetical protein